MEKNNRSIHKIATFTWDIVLFVYVFVMLIFKNEIVFKIGEGRFYLFIFLGGIGIWGVNKMIGLIHVKFKEN